MKKQILIGESGGSKTDWAFLLNDELVWQFSFSSLHPKHWKAEIFKELIEELKSRDLEFELTMLYFFGAGCNNEESAIKMRETLSDFNFKETNIAGDLKAAGLSTLNNGSGYVAILGSGSVLIDFQEGEVKQYFGGLGREKGDEGGGYYFGKLILTALQNKQLKPIQESILKSVMSSSEQNAIAHSEISDELCLKLANRLGNYLFEFQDFHLENFELFYSKYVKQNISNGETIHFVGSYAYFHQELIKTFFLSKGLSIGQFVERPIEKLIEYFKTKTEHNK